MDRQTVKIKTAWTCRNKQTEEKNRSVDIQIERYIDRQILKIKTAWKDGLKNLYRQIKKINRYTYKKIESEREKGIERKKKRVKKNIWKSR